MHSEVAPGNEEFQQAIRRAVPLGWVFKGFPQHHAHASVGLMRKALLEEEQVGGRPRPGEDAWRRPMERGACASGAG